MLNFLWVIFSLPFFTIGASTTALFYVTGKIIRDENYKSLTGAFWHSFKNNFKNLRNGLGHIGMLGLYEALGYIRVI